MAYQLVNNGDVPDEDYFNESLMRQVVVKCTSGTRPSSPDEGMVVYETDTNSLRVYTGSAWVRFGFYAETQGTGAATEGTDISGITSTTFTAGSPVCGVAFVAPPSGGVYVTVSGRISQSTNTFETRLGWELRTGNSVGSGTITVGADFNRSLTCGRAVTSGGASVVNGSRRFRIDAGTLTAGADYNVRTMHAVDNASASGGVEHREILVEPVL